jgi:hypothetical protein
MSPLENISVDFLDFWVGQIEEGRRGTIRPVTGRRRLLFFKSPNACRLGCQGFA